MSHRAMWAIKITHIPTGTSVETDSHLFRTQEEAHDAMIKLLKSKLWYCDKSLLSKESLFTKETYEAELEMQGSDFVEVLRLSELAKRINYFTKLMNEVPKGEPRYEQIVKAYEEHIEKIKQEEDID